ncbi:MAG: Uma2 family endonuclease [Anaerolineae bacterium]|nr:Uma2 family endonuclease [Anaerolineae bacterium]
MLNVQPAVVTKEEFYEFVLRPENRDRNFEYIAGEIVEVVSNNESSEAAAKLIAYFGNYVLVNKLGRITGADGGYVINGEDYMPDAAFMSRKRQPVRPNKVAYNPVAPDLAIEVLSPGNSASEIAIKSAHYMAAGTVLWLTDPEAKTIDVWIPGQPVKRLRVGDVLEGGDVLPGFKLEVADIFDD